MLINYNISSAKESFLKANPRKFLLPLLYFIIFILFVQTAIVHFENDGRSNHETHESKLATPTLSSKPRPQIANVTTSNKVAVMIETRRSGNLIPLILHFSAVLGPSWPIVIYTSAENLGIFSTSSALLRHRSTGRITVRSLAPGTAFNSWESVSEFLTTKWLWNDLAPAEHIFMFQTDSILCSNAPRSVDDFLEYDLIGAPILGAYGQGYNGGLGIRSRSVIMRILDEFDYRDDPSRPAEDQWFYARFKDLQRKEIEQGIKDGINLPSMEIARTFAVETIDYPHPLGLHQPSRFIHKYMVDLDKWCPEYRLATTERISA